MMMLIPLAPRLLPIAGAWRVALMMSDPLLNLFLLTSPLRRTRSVHLATTSCSIRGAKGGRRRLVGRRQRRTDGRPAGPSCASLLLLQSSRPPSSTTTLARHSSPRNSQPPTLHSSSGTPRDAAARLRPSIRVCVCVCGHLLTSTPPN